MDNLKLNSVQNIYVIADYPSILAVTYTFVRKEIFPEDLYSDIKVDKVVITCFWYLRTCLLQLRQGLAN